MLRRMAHLPDDMTGELTGLNRRYAHLHTPKHLTNPDHLDPKLSSDGAPLRIAARYTQGRIPLQQQTVSGRKQGEKDPAASGPLPRAGCSAPRLDRRAAHSSRGYGSHRETRP